MNKWEILWNQTCPDGEIVDHFPVNPLQQEERARATNWDLMLRMKIRAPGAKFCLIYSVMNPSPVARRRAGAGIHK